MPSPPSSPSPPAKPLSTAAKIPYRPSSSSNEPSNQAAFMLSSPKKYDQQEQQQLQRQQMGEHLSEQIQGLDMNDNEKKESAFSTAGSGTSLKLQPRLKSSEPNNDSDTDWVYLATSSSPYGPPPSSYENNEINGDSKNNGGIVVSGMIREKNNYRMSNDSLAVQTENIDFDSLSSSSSSSSPDDDNDDALSNKSEIDEEERHIQQPGVFQRTNFNKDTRGNNPKYNVALSDDGGSYHGDMILTDDDDDEDSDSGNDTDEEGDRGNEDEVINPLPIRKATAAASTTRKTTFSAATNAPAPMAVTAAIPPSNNDTPHKTQKQKVQATEPGGEKNRTGLMLDFPSLSKRKLTVGRVKKSRMPRRLSSTNEDEKKSAAAAAQVPTSSAHSPPNTPRYRLPGSGAKKKLSINKPRNASSSHSGGESGEESDISSQSLSSDSSFSEQSNDLCESPDRFPEGYVPSIFYNNSGNSFLLHNDKGADNHQVNNQLKEKQSGNDEDNDNENNNFVKTYFDQSLLSDGMPINLLSKFASEHQILIRAITQLLAERDHVGVEANVDDPHTMMSGTLKKSVGYIKGSVWKTRYCEVRKGYFTYYEDTSSFPSSSSAAEVASRAAATAGGGLSSSSVTRRNIPLRSSLCTCRAVMVGKLKTQKKSKASAAAGSGGGGSGILGGSGYAFELKVEGGPKRLWMAKTKEERQAWIHIIHEAMIGPPRGLPTDADVGLGESKKNNSLALTRHSDSLEKYLHAQSKTRTAMTKKEYMDGLADMLGNSVCVPVRWIKEQVDSPMISSLSLSSKNNYEEEHNTIGGRMTSSSESKFWEDILKSSFSINGYVLKGDSKYGPERIVGALSRCILEFDKGAVRQQQMQQESELGECKVGSSGEQQHTRGKQSTADEMSEVQAISYARDILLACNRTLRNNDSYLNAEALCSNPDLVVLCPKDSVSLPLCVTVSHAESEPCAKRPQKNSADPESPLWCKGKSGWIAMNDGTHRSWKKRFFVLSQYMLSYFEKEHPMPQGMKGNLALPGAKLEIKEIGNGEGGSEFLKRLSGGSSAGGGGIGSVANKAREAYRRSRSVGHGLASRYVACLVLRDQTKECMLCFDDRSDFVAWKDALQLAINACSQSTHVTDSPLTSSLVSGTGASYSEPGVRHNRVSSDSLPRTSEPEVPPSSPNQNLCESSGKKNTTGLNFLRSLNRRDSGTSPCPGPPSPPATPPTTPRSTSRDGSSNGKLFGRSGAKERTHARYDSIEDGQMRNLAMPDVQDIQTSTTRPSKSGKRTSLLPSLTIDLPKLRNTNATPVPEHLNSSTERIFGQSMSKPTVNIVVEECALYKIFTADPTGDEVADTWAMLKTNIVLSFLLSGGPTGRIVQGEDLVEISLTEGLAVDENE